LRFLEVASIINSSDEELTDNEYDVFIKEFGEYQNEIYCGVMEGDERLTFFLEDQTIHISDWEKKENKHSFEKILYPIMGNFRLGYLDKNKSK